MSIRPITLRNPPEKTWMLKKEFDSLHFVLQTETSFIEFAHVRWLYLEHYDKVSKHKSTSGFREMFQWWQIIIII